MCCEAEDVKKCPSVALRDREIKQKFSNFVRGDLSIHFLQKFRGSPAYFNKMLYDLHEMIRQLGPCT